MSGIASNSRALTYSYVVGRALVLTFRRRSLLAFIGGDDTCAPRKPNMARFGVDEGGAIAGGYSGKSCEGSAAGTRTGRISCGQTPGDEVKRGDPRKASWLVL